MLSADDARLTGRAFKDALSRGVVVKDGGASLLLLTARIGLGLGLTSLMRCWLFKVDPTSPAFDLELTMARCSPPWLGGVARSRPLLDVCRPDLERATAEVPPSFLADAFHEFRGMYK